MDSIERVSELSAPMDLRGKVPHPPANYLITTDRAIIPVFPHVQLREEERATTPVYPNALKKLKYPNFAGGGPLNYDLREIPLLLHPDQRRGQKVSGLVLLQYLEETKIFENDERDNRTLLGACFNLQDGHAILNNGVEPFVQVFGKKSLVLWKTVAELDYDFADDKTHLFVSYLHVLVGALKLGWMRLSHELDPSYVTPHFIGRQTLA